MAVPCHFQEGYLSQGVPYHPESPEHAYFVKHWSNANDSYSYFSVVTLRIQFIEYRQHM